MFLLALKFAAILIEISVHKNSSVVSEKNNNYLGLVREYDKNQPNPPTHLFHLLTKLPHSMPWLKALFLDI